MAYAISHFFEWGLVPDSLLATTLAEYADCGAENLVLMHQWSERLLAEPEFSETLRRHVETFRLGFSGAHAPFGEQWDLGAAPADEPAMIDGQSRVIRAAGTLGIDTITIHVRISDDRGEAVVAQVRKLLPAAEAAGVVLALENGFSAASFAFLNGIVDRVDSRWVGCCFDTGHANLAAAASGCSLAALIDTPELREFAEKIVVVHVHDNHGAKDEHLLAGDGAIDWTIVAPWLCALPRVRSIQNECAAFRCHTSVLRQALEFRRLFRRA